MEIFEEHPFLYHYTSSSGLKGILESQVLHATHYAFLNDKTEMQVVRPKLVELVQPSIYRAYHQLSGDPGKKRAIDEQGGIDVLSAHDAEKFVATAYNLTLGRALSFQYFEPHIVSFCGHADDYSRENGLLSQWRGYGADSGYAVVFDTRKLASTLEVEARTYLYSSFSIGSVIYDSDKASFDAEFHDLVNLVDEVVEPTLRGADSRLRDLWAPLISAISRFKHAAFREEQEVRIVASPMSKQFLDHMNKEDADFMNGHKGKTLKSRQFRSDLSSYISLCDVAKRLPIVKIIVGPSPDQDTRRQRLLRYLDLVGSEIDVWSSETPLVGR